LATAALSSLTENKAAKRRWKKGSAEGAPFPSASGRGVELAPIKRRFDWRPDDLNHEKHERAVQSVNKLSGFRLSPE
jgi:hypothetical protein